MLQTLDLSWNSLRLKGALAIAQGLKSNQMLKVLNLSYNGFGNNGAIALADALKMNSTLTELDITYVSYCSIINHIVCDKDLLVKIYMYMYLQSHGIIS